MSHDVKIGQLIDESAQRDAIHVAIAPVVAGTLLSPGERIRLDSEGLAVHCTQGTPTGIVDPFLATKVHPGKRFYMFLMPNTVTGMRHHWSHPAFGAEQPAAPSTDKAFSEMWLRVYASKVNCYYDPEQAYQTLMSDIASGDITYHGTDMHSRDELIDADDLRKHASIVLGRDVNWDNFESFSCTC